MRITKTIKVPAVPAKKAHTRELPMYVCDICGKESKSTIASCVLCERDICKTFSLSTEICRKYDPEDYGDYPASYCIRCYHLRFKKYAKVIEAIKEEAYRQEEEIIAQIIKESLGEKNTA